MAHYPKIFDFVGSGGDGGGTQSIDISEVAFGTGTGITSSDAFTWDNSYFNLKSGRKNAIKSFTGDSSIIGGVYNDIYSSQLSTILGGLGNSLTYLNDSSSIIGGCSNTIRYNNSATIVSSDLGYIYKSTQSGILSSNESKILNSQRSSIISSNISCIYTNGIIKGHNNINSGRKVVICDSCYSSSINDYSVNLNGVSYLSSINNQLVTNESTKSFISNNFNTTNTRIKSDLTAFINNTDFNVTIGSELCRSTIISSYRGLINSINFRTLSINSISDTFCNTNYTGSILSCYTNFYNSRDSLNILGRKNSLTGTSQNTLLTNSHYSSISGGIFNSIQNSKCNSISSGCYNSIQNSYCTYINFSQRTNIIGSHFSNSYCSYTSLISSSRDSRLSYATRSSIISSCNSCILNSNNSSIIGGNSLALNLENDVVYLSTLKMATASTTSDTTRVLNWDADNYVRPFISGFSGTFQDNTSKTVCVCNGLVISVI